MKKLLTLALAVLMCVFAISAMADTVSIDRTLELQFVPSKDADVIITGTKNLPELLKAALLEQGYDVKDINITVGTNYEATGEAPAPSIWAGCRAAPTRCSATMWTSS
mgnify:CR=1 FL=1